MVPKETIRGTWFAALVVLITWVGPVRSASAEGAARDLSGFTDPGVVFTVSIDIDAPAGTILVGLEDTPPPGWSVSNISDGGTWDEDPAEIKWGPFFDPSIPEQVTYDLDPPSDLMGPYCFVGEVVFDTVYLPIEGDQCVAVGIPTLSRWGMIFLTLLVLTAGTLVFMRRLPSRMRETNRVS